MPTEVETVVRDMEMYKSLRFNDVSIKVRIDPVSLYGHVVDHVFIKHTDLLRKDIRVGDHIIVDKDYYIVTALVEKRDGSQKMFVLKEDE